MTEKRSESKVESHRAISLTFKLLFLASIFIFLFIPFISSQGFIQGGGSVSVSTTTYSGNLTNLSQLEDTNIVSPADTYVLTWNDTSGKWYPASAASVGDTNETDRFNALTAVDCATDYAVKGVYDNGTVVCVSIASASESDPYWTANYSAYNDSWSLDTNTQLSGTDVINYVGNWSADKPNYYTSTQIDANNDSVNNYILYVNSTNPGGLSAESDPYWAANYTAYNSSWSADTNILDTNEYNVTQFNEDSGQLNIIISWLNDLITSVSNALISTNNDSVNNYIADNNNSVNNYILYVNRTNGAGSGTESDPIWTANYSAYNESWSLDTDTWVANYSNYYTKAEINSNNDSMNNYILYVNSTNGAGSGGGFTTDQNAQLNTTGSPKFVNTTLTGNLSITQGRFTIVNPLDTNAILIDQNGNASSSTSTGGAINLDNTGNTGAGIVVYSNIGATADGRLLVLRADNSAFDQQVLFVQQDGISGGFFTDCNNPTGNSVECASVDSEKQDVSAVGVTGQETDKGTVKITHEYPGVSDANAAALSIALSGVGTSAQGIFIDAATGTTGKLINVRNGSNEKFILLPDGNATFETDVCLENGVCLSSLSSYDDNWINNTIDSKISSNNDSVNNYILYVNSTNPGGISAESDPYWTANYSAYNNSWNLDTNILDTNEYNTTHFDESGGVLTIVQSWLDSFITAIANALILTNNESVNNYITDNNNSVNNYILYVNSTNGAGGISTESDPYWAANYTAYNNSWSTDTDTWVANYSNYYTKTEVDAQNTSQTNYINANNNSVTNTIQSVRYLPSVANVTCTNTACTSNITFNGTHTIWW